MTKGNIMIVEDNRELANIYEKALFGKGFNIVSKVYDGKEAIEFYRNADYYPDVIIMDYRMPIINGLIASSEILEINSNQKIIFASADESIKLKVKKLGFRQFKKKPFDISYLIQNIDKAINFP